MDYTVGQVLYVILRKKQIVLPVRVVEQIIRRTISGEEAKYIVEVPTKGQKLANYPLDKLGGDVFDNLESPRQLLLTNAMEAIDDIVSLADRTAEKHFITPDNQRNEPEFNSSHPISAENSQLSNIVEATMDDGTLVKVHMPDLDAGGVMI